MSWSATGGACDVTESCMLPVNGDKPNRELILTGNLGDVLKESTHIALSYLQSNMKSLGIEGSFLFTLFYDTIYTD